MLIAIDIGNTNIVFGIFKAENLLNSFRIQTNTTQTSDEYGIIFRNLLAYNQIPDSEIRYGIICCVVPPLQSVIEDMLKRYFHITPMLVEPGLKTGVSILYENPREVGADRIVNAVAAYTLYRSASIVVDFGTATTFDCISAKGEYLGGLIYPGIKISLESLFVHTAKLPQIDIAKPKGIIGKNTVQAMQSGIFYGYISMVDGLVEKIKTEMRDNPKVIATGGFAELIGPESKNIERVDHLLTLKGLLILFNKNK